MVANGEERRYIDGFWVCDSSFFGLRGRTDAAVAADSIKFFFILS
jgi:hypothetical protein